MQRIGIVFDEVFKQHETGEGHPERPARMDAVSAGLEESGVLRDAKRIEAKPADPVLVERIHERGYLERVRAACEQQRRFVDDPDCATCARTYEIAFLAAGGTCEAARRVGRGDVRTAFCAVRPPGHHAERERAMGFCFLNNVALAAETLRSEFGLTRVLILDWDVHHGNGTQQVFERSAEVLFISLHGHPESLYPGTGYADEQGTGPGAGFTINIPMRPNSGDAEYREAFVSTVIPAADRFAPQAVLLSAGFDAHADDPLGNQRLSDATYEFMLRETVAIAKKHCDGRIVSVLEGGYDLEVLRRCVSRHVQILAEG